MRKHILFLAITTFSIITLSAQTVYLNEDFNGATAAPTGWTNNAVSGTQVWAFGDDGSRVGGTQNLDGTDMAYFDDDALLGSSTDNTVELITPTFNNASSGATFLEFDYNFRELAAPPIPDSFYVDVNDGTNWVRVFSRGTDDCGNWAGICAGNYPHAVINISAYANANCQVRFTYFDGNDWGWYVGIDNVVIYSPLADDVGVTQVLSPESGCGMSNAETIQVRIQNFGSSAASNFDVTFDMNNGAQSYTETITASIAATDSLDYTFTATADFSVAGNYSITAYTDYSADGNRSNDTTLTSIENQQLFTPTFFDDFEGANNWKVEGTNASWELGVPAAGNTVINSAVTGMNAYVTNLGNGTGNAYNNNEQSYLVSPCFDFSQGVGDPIVTFDLIYLTEGVYDGLLFESSIDGGITWQKVGPSVSATNWYGPNPTNRWEGNSNGWNPVENVLTGLGGQSQVNLRFRFESDPSTTLEGVGVDNFAVRFPPSIDISMNELSYPSSSGIPLCGYGNENIIVELENKGANIIDTVFLGYRVNGGAISSDTLIANLAPNTTTSYTFNNKYDFSAITTYSIDVWASATGDGFGPNDTLFNNTITNQAGGQVLLTPFVENFDGPGWVIGGNNNWNGSVVGPGWNRTTTSGGFGQYQWNVYNATTGSGATGPDTDRSGTGNYLYTEASGGGAGDVATLETPCIDLSNNQGAVLEFYSHRFGTVGDMGPLRVDVYDGTSWVQNIEVITPLAQNSGAGPWTFHSVNLTPYAGRRIKVRFRAISRGCCQGDMAIDDLLLYEPIPQDAEMLSIITPNNAGDACGVSANSDFTVEVGNFGTAAILPNTLPILYQVDNLPPVRDTLTTGIPIGGSTTFTFAVGPNLSVRGQQYNIKTWTELNGDSNNGNDSILNYRLTNQTRAAGYIETFESFNFIDGGCGSPDGDLIANGWSVSPGDYTWNLQNASACAVASGATNTTNTGPLGDHTIGGGKFFYTEVDPTSGTTNVGDVAELLSPCIDFTQKGGATVAFWYHRYGNNMGAFAVDVKVNGTWTNGVTTFNANTSPQSAAGDAWLLGSANIGNIAAGNLVQVRFRAIRGNGVRGDMSLDDIEFFEPIPIDARVSRIISPVTQCSPSGTVSIEVENFGSSDITSPIEVGFQVDNGGVVLDTIVFTPTTPLAVAGKQTFTFPLTANLSKNNTTFAVSAWTSMPLDSNTFNDTLVSNVINQTQDLIYEEDFESFTDGGTCANGFNAVLGDVYTNGWTETSAANSTFVWSVQDMGQCNGTPSGGTGPDNDHTTGLGKFLYTEATGTNGTAQIESPCIDFTGQDGAAMKFWYHRAGGNMGPLNVDVFADGMWNMGVFTLNGAAQTATNDPWLEADAKFNQFKNKEIRVRFRGTRGGGFTSDMAIDDISFYAPLGNDARMLAVTAPVSGCLINDSSIVSVQLQNFGTLTINEQPAANMDSLVVGMQVEGDPTIYYDTVRQTIVADQVVDFTFTSTVDLSTRGQKYSIKTWTALIGEQDFENDTFVYVVQNQTKITNFKEDFETSRDAKCDDMLGQVLENGWVTPSNSTFNWNVQSSICGKGNTTTPTNGTGPGGDHTTGRGMFLYTEGNGTGTALLESPCIDLTGNTEARLNFWYHRYGINQAQSPLFVDVYQDGNVIPGVATITGQNQTSPTASWQQFTVNLDQYVGGLIQVAFRASKNGGGPRRDIGLDDIMIYDPVDKDAGITDIISPTGDGCNLGDTTQIVSVSIENFGKTAIGVNELYIEYNDNNGVFYRDTVAKSIAPGFSIIDTFSQPIDLSGPGRHTIRARTVLAMDSIPQNDLSIKMLENTKPGVPRYFMDFENHVMGAPAPNYNQDDLRGFTRSPATGGPGTYMWHVQCGAGPYVNGGSTILPMPDIPQTGPSGDHTFATSGSNGKGCYMLVESDVVAQTGNTSNPRFNDAFLTLPCGPIDFTQSVNNEVLFSYWYHMYGAEAGALYVDIEVDTGSGPVWINRIDVVRGQQQTDDDTEPWLKRQISISRFVAGQSAVRIRFRAENAWDQNRMFEGRGGDIGVDDIEILDRIDRDASVVEVREPDSDCNLTNSERFLVRMQNTGTQDILKVKMGYQITHTPFGGTPTVGPIVKDSVLQTVIPLAFYDFEFDRIDMSLPGEYKITVWTEYENDGYSFNDTLCYDVTNTTRPFPSCEDFSDLLFDDIANTYKDFILPNDWEGVRNGYAFKASIGGNGGGPFNGNTSGLNDVYLLVDNNGVPPPTPTTITSPCFDLTNTQAANLEFYYRITAPNPFLIIKGIRNGGAPINLDTIVTTTPFWTKRRVVLSDFVGTFTSIEFEAFSSGSGFYAIDDVCLVEPRPQQIAFQEFVTPQQGLCFYDTNETVTLRVRNIGLDNIDRFSVVLAVDKTIQSFPLGNQFRDTIEVGPGLTPAFVPGSRRDIVLDLPEWLQDLNSKTSYFLHAYILLPGDNDFEDNYQENYRINHPIATKLPYIIDFEKGLEATGLSFGGGMYTWYNLANNGLFATGLDGTPAADRGLTGPESDHTFGTLSDGSTPGHHMITQAAGGMPGDGIVAQSGCIDLSTAIAPEIRYWYHMFGFQMGELYLQFNDDTGWETVDSLLTEDLDQRFGHRTAWKPRTIKLDQYKGKFVRFRFVSFKGGGSASNMAIDDISVYDLAAKDIRPISLAKPTGDSTECYAVENELCVNLINNGSNDIDFESDSTEVTVIILKDNQGDGMFVRHDSLFQLVTENFWVSGATGDTMPLPRDSVVKIKFDSVFDMSDTGSFFRFFVDVNMYNDPIKSNDTYSTIIKSQRKVGETYLFEQDDTVCAGKEVTVRVRNNFGTIRWEERIERKAGDKAVWFPGFNFPFDSMRYSAVLDTTTSFRPRVCGHLRFTADSVDEVADSIRIVAINPVLPVAMHDSRCQGDDPVMTLGASVPTNISQVRFYDNPFANGIPQTVRNAPFTIDRSFLETDTIYMQSIIESPNVVGPGDTTFAKPNGYCTSDWRGDLVPVIATVNDTAIFDLGDDDTLCSVPGPGQLEASSVVLDGGQVEGRRDTYLWHAFKRTSTSPEVFEIIDTFYTQTVVVDAWRLSLDTAYLYELTVTTDSGCVTGPDSVRIFVDDTCIVGIDEARFRNTFNVHPNPVSDQLNIIHQSFENFTGSIRLLTMDGQLIEVFDDVDFGNLNKQIDMGTLPKGVYIIKVDTEKGSFVEKIIRS